MAKTKEEKNAYNREWRRNNPDKVKGYNAKYAASDKGKAAKKRASDKYFRSPKGKAASERAKLSKYGISPTMYALMYAEQGGVCAICHQPEKEGRSLAVDHNHTTDEVRGLLCMECNTGLGKFKDNTEVLSRAIEYVEKVHTLPTQA